MGDLAQVTIAFIFTTNLIYLTKNLLQLLYINTNLVLLIPQPQLPRGLSRSFVHIKYTGRLPIFRIFLIPRRFSSVSLLPIFFFSIFFLIPGEGARQFMELRSHDRVSRLKDFTLISEFSVFWRCTSGVFMRVVPMFARIRSHCAGEKK